MQKTTFARGQSGKRPLDLDQRLQPNRVYATQCRSQLRWESMEDPTKEKEANQRGALPRTPNAAKPDKNREKVAKQIDPQRLYEAIQYLKKHPQPPWR
jgi:hypothetical protein